MKELFGSPGKVSGLILRMGQCLFAAASIAVMASYLVLCPSQIICGTFLVYAPLKKLLIRSYLIASMGLQFLWSFSLACLDIHALRLKRDLWNYIFLSLLVVGDWVTAILSLAAACSSAGVVVLIVKDTNMCKRNPQLSCNMFQISVALAFISWFFLAISSCVMFWRTASE